MRPSSASSRSEAALVRLEPLEIWMERGPGPLRPQVLAALRPHGEPLRWAITAVEPSGFTTVAIAGPALGDQGGDRRSRLRLEAVMLR